MTQQQAENEPSGSCHYCGPTDRELRPYGPGGTDVCFPCATATPEREQSAKNAFGTLLDGAEVISSGPVMIGSDEGPIPFDPERLSRPGERA